MSRFAVILAAAGKSSRFDDGHYKKPFAILNRKAVWLHSADRFLKRDDVKQMIIVIAESDQEDFYSKFGANIAVSGIEVVIGGTERCESIANALKKVAATSDFVAIHDAARPCVSEDDIEAVFAAAKLSNAAILACPVTNTLKRSADGKTIDGSIERTRLWQAMTPQVFGRQLITSAYDRIGDEKPTDEAQLLEIQGQAVSIVPGSAMNIKITTKSDLAWARACVEAMPKPKFDAPIHPFGDDKLWR